MKSKGLFLVLTFVLSVWAVAQTPSHLDIVKGPVADQITANSVVVSWSTNEQSSAVVKYGTDKNNLGQTAQGAWGGVDHKLVISNLKPNTTYYFQVISSEGEASGTGSLARILSFKTSDTASVAPAAGTMNAAETGRPSKVLIVDGPKVEFVDDKAATIAWTTNAPSSAVVHYGTDRSKLDMSAQQQWGGDRAGRGQRIHRVEIKDLKPNTAYFFQVESGQSRGTGTTVSSDVMPLKTLTVEAAASEYQKKVGQTALKFQAGPVPQSLTDKTATLWLMTSEDASVMVKYGTDRNSLNMTAQSPTGTKHQLQLTNLQPSTTYFFEASAADGRVKEAGQFQTENANFASERPRVYLTKGPVIEYIDKDHTILAWSTNVRSSSMVRYGTDPNNLSQTAQAPWGQETHRVEVKNLKPNMKYYFVVESAQAEGSGTLAKSNPAPFVTVAEGQQAMRNPGPQ